MKIALKIFIALVIVAFLLVVGLIAWFISNNHPDPLFNIGNNFPQTVIVYLDGHNMGRIDPSKSKVFYPGEVIKTHDEGLLVELKSNSGVVLFSRLYNWDEYRAVLESVKGQPYWIGNDTTFGIYLADTGELVLSQDDIKAYYDNSHSIELNSQGIAKWNSFHTYTGVPKMAQSLFNRDFIIKSNDKEICRGKFYSLASSASYSGLAIIDALIPLDSENTQLWIISNYPNNALGPEYSNVSSELVSVFGELNLLR